VADDEVLVDAARRCGEAHDLVLLADRLFVAHDREIDTGDLQLGGGTRSLIQGARIAAGESSGEYLGLLPCRGDEAVETPVVLCALADGVDIRGWPAGEVIAHDN